MDVAEEGLMSLNKSDIYGMIADKNVNLQPTSVSGPDQGAVAPMVGNPPSALTGTPSSAAFTWVGFILALIILRLLIDYGGKD